MDTRRTSGPRPSAELGTDTVPVDLVELVDLRYVVNPRAGTGFRAIVAALVVIAIVATIAALAIATSNGWSILDAY